MSREGTASAKVLGPHARKVLMEQQVSKAGEGVQERRAERTGRLGLGGLGPLEGLASLTEEGVLQGDPEEDRPV